MEAWANETKPPHQMRLKCMTVNINFTALPWLSYLYKLCSKIGPLVGKKLIQSSDLILQSTLLEVAVWQGGKVISNL